MSLTEGALTNYAGLDRWDDARILEALADGQARALAAVRQALPAIARAAEAMAKGLREGGRLIYAGAGTSIRIAVQDGAELPATFGMDKSRLIFVIAGGRNALFEGDGRSEDDTQAPFVEIERLKLTPADVVVAVSASGSTPYTLAAARAARSAQAIVIGVANNPAAPLLAAADHPILLDSGAEVIAGSTRMGAGTAQKCALNLLSTLAHIRLGCVYDSWMIKLRADNAKLRKRAQRMVADIAKVDEASAEKALARAEGHVAPAALICAGAKDFSVAQTLLAQANGNLRLALEKLAGSV